MNQQDLIDIPGYRVHGRLGKGGMAEVYLATQESLQRQVAIKVLLSSADEAFSQRFIKEGHILASLHHPSIITIHDIDRLADGRHYLAMEFVAGGDLAQFKGQVFEPSRALQIVRQVASALAVVHARGLVHRDIKPANILFREDGTAVLTDFGVAKEMALDRDLTQHGIAVGSPAYSSPEQAQCQSLDARSDIYGLGVILLEMLTGTNPYRGANYTQTLMNQVQMPMPCLPAELARYQALLDGMLAKDPEQRFADCRALLESLDALSEESSGKARGQGVPAPVAEGSKSSAEGWRGARVWGLLALLLVGVGSVAGYYGYRQLQLADYLTQAEQRLDQGKLVEPVQDNADYFFRQALSLDAHNPQAMDGLERVLQARVQGHLSLAEERFGQGLLLLPEDDSATFYYRQALALDAHSEPAQAGLARVVQAYIEQSEQAYRRREFALALTAIQQGLEVDPANETLLKRLDQHEQRVRQARAQAAARRQAAQSAPRETRPAQSAQQGQPQTSGSSNPIKRLWNNIFQR